MPIYSLRKDCCCCARMAFVLLVIAQFVVCGCGGGGGLSGPPPGETMTFHVDPGASAKGTIGDITVNVPTGTFPAGGDVTMTVYPKSQDPKVASQLWDATKELVVQTDVSSQLPLQVEFRNARVDSLDQSITLIRANSRWYLIDSIVQDGVVKVQLKLPDEQATPADRSVLEWIINRGYVAPIEHTFTLNRIAGNGDLGQGSLFVVHGMMSDVHTFDLLAPRAVSEGRYKNVYALGYDWRLSSAEIAQFLESKLNEARNRGVHKSIDILGHSRGVLVVRHTLEILGCTDTINNAYLLMGPNEGTFVANKYNAERLIIEWYLNLATHSTIGSWLCGFNAPALDELFQNSSYTHNLNSNHGQRGEVHYTITAAGQDELVPENSALVLDYDLEAFTGGAIQRKTFQDFAHSTILKEQRGVNELLELLSLSHSYYLDFYADPNPVDINFWTGTWIWESNFKNTQPNQIIVKDICFDLYDRYGKWTNTAWYDPNLPPGSNYPDKPVKMNTPLGPNQWLDKNISTEAHRSDADNERAATCIITIRFDDSSGKGCEANYDVVLYDGDIYPQSPNTRSRGRSEGIHHLVVTKPIKAK